MIPNLKVQSIRWLFDSYICIAVSKSSWAVPDNVLTHLRQHGDLKCAMGTVEYFVRFSVEILNGENREHCQKVKCIDCRQKKFKKNGVPSTCTTLWLSF